MLSRSLNVRCGWCGEVSYLGTWNDKTYEKCTNREMKRAFVALTNERAFLRKTDSFYICPCCEKWSRGSQLKIVNTEDAKLLRLGGETTVSAIKSSN